jgi:hypothetical protein
MKICELTKDSGIESPSSGEFIRYMGKTLIGYIK